MKKLKTIATFLLTTLTTTQMAQADCLTAYDQKIKSLKSQWLSPNDLDNHSSSSISLNGLMVPEHTGAANGIAFLIPLVYAGSRIWIWNGIQSPYVRAEAVVNAAAAQKIDSDAIEQLSQFTSIGRRKLVRIINEANQDGLFCSETEVWTYGQITSWLLNQK